MRCADTAGYSIVHQLNGLTALVTENLKADPFSAFATLPRLIVAPVERSGGFCGARCIPRAAGLEFESRTFRL